MDSEVVTCPIERHLQRMLHREDGICTAKQHTAPDDETLTENRHRTQNRHNLPHTDMHVPKIFTFHKTMGFVCVCLCFPHLSRRKLSLGKHSSQMSSYVHVAQSLHNLYTLDTKVPETVSPTSHHSW